MTVVFLFGTTYHRSQSSRIFYKSDTINKGITVFKIFIWGGISSDIRSEIKFYGDARAEP